MLLIRQILSLNCWPDRQCKHWHCLMDARHAIKQADCLPAPQLGGRARRRQAAPAPLISAPRSGTQADDSSRALKPRSAQSSWRRQNNGPERQASQVALAVHNQQAGFIRSAFGAAFGQLASGPVCRLAGGRWRARHRCPALGRARLAASSGTLPPGRRARPRQTNKRAPNQPAERQPTRLLLHKCTGRPHAKRMHSPSG